MNYPLGKYNCGSASFLIIAAVIIAVVLVLFVKNMERAAVKEVMNSSNLKNCRSGEEKSSKTEELSKADASAAKLPKLVELGSKKCVPCRMMGPIIEELKREYAGKLDVQFIDVNENKEAVNIFKVKTIPTQVFLDRDGREIFRHEGFFPKEGIVARWKELGVNLDE